MRTKQEMLEAYFNVTRTFDKLEEQEFMVKILSDFEAFCHYVIGHKIGDYHREVFSYLKNPRVCLMSPRGHAKTELISVCYTLWRSLNKEELNIVIISNSELQSNRIIRRIRNYIENNELLIELKPPSSKVFWNKSTLPLSNKTVINSQPFTDSIRGDRIDLCICDDILKKELAEQSPTIIKFFEIIEPAVDKEGSQLIVVGTPQSDFDLLHKLGEEGSGYKFRKFQCCKELVSGHIRGPVLFPERWNTEKLQQRYTNMGMAAFMQEYMCTPIQPGDILFDYDTVIKPAIDENIEELDHAIPAREYWMGVDIALSKDRAADRSAYVVLEKRPGDKVYRVVRVERPPKGTYTQDQFDRIVALHKAFNFKRIVIENKGNSMSLVEFLQREPSTCAQTEDFPTTHNEKERIITKTQKLMQNGLLEIYPSSPLINELRSMGIKHKISAGRSTERIESLTGKDDTVMALALAVEGATSKTGEVSALWV